MSAVPLKTPRRPGGRSRCRTPRRPSTEARRAPGASRSSLLAFVPPTAKAKRADAKRASRDGVRPPPTRATSSRNGARNHLGTPSEIKSEWRARSSRIRGPLPPESARQRGNPDFATAEHLANVGQHRVTAFTRFAAVSELGELSGTFGHAIGNDRY